MNAVRQIMFLLLFVGNVLTASGEGAIDIVAPTDFINFDELDQSIASWKQNIVATLNDKEIEFVAHVVKFGSLFSLIDLQARKAVRLLLPLVWQLQEEIAAGKTGLALLNQMKEQSEKLHDFVVQRDTMLNEGEDLQHALKASKNKKVQEAIEVVHDQIKLAIEQCLACGDWQHVVTAVLPILDDGIKAGTMTSSLCKSFALSGSDTAKHDTGISTWLAREDIVSFFSWLTRAVTVFNTRSWESIQATSQLLAYQEELLTIKGVIYNKYLRVLRP